MTRRRPSLAARYKAWVRANATLVTAVESAASSATWLLPDRFGGDELAAEAIHSGLGLASVYHEAVLQEAEAEEEGVAGTSGSPPAWPLWLAALQQVEVLVEIGARRASSSGALADPWGPLLLLETTKAALRLAVLARAGGRLTLDGGCTPPPPGAPGVVAPPRPPPRGARPAHDDGHHPHPHHRGASKAARRAARAAAVFAAFAAFRESHGLPAVPAYARAASSAGGALSAAALGAAAVAAVAASPGEAAVAAVAEREGREAADAAEMAGRKLGGGEGGGGGGPRPRPRRRRWWDDPAPARPPPPAAQPPPPPAGPPAAIDLAALDAAAEAAAWRGAGLLAAGEFLFIVRPVLYVAALRAQAARARRGRARAGRAPRPPSSFPLLESAWWPWCLSLALDAASGAALRAGAAAASAGAAAAAATPGLGPASPVALAYRAQAFAWHPAEARELGRRRGLLWLYALRAPAWDALTARLLAGAEAGARRVPLLGGLAGKAAEVVRGVQGYYTYTSGS